MVVLVLVVNTYDNGGRWQGLKAREITELRTARQGSAEQPLPGERRSEQLRDVSSVRARPLGVVWVVTSYPLVAAGLEKTLEGKADVRIGGSAPAGSLSSIVLYADGTEAGFVGDLKRMRTLHAGVPLLVFGARLDLQLAQTALENGADGFVHAAMDREQVVKAVEVVQKGELVAPRQLLKYILTHGKTPDVGDLSPRQREILGLVAEDLSNAEIAKRLYLSESTVKQHLRTAYKLLGVRNRTEAAKMVKNHGRDL
jgi:DNA-binding NarL/FixJ family response regulator